MSFIEKNQYHQRPDHCLTTLYEVIKATWSNETFSVLLMKKKLLMKQNFSHLFMEEINGLIRNVPLPFIVVKVFSTLSGVTDL